MTEQMTLTIEGMTCGHCLRAVSSALEETPGVQVERVELGKAVVRYESDLVGPDAVVDAVTEAGYAAWRSDP